MPSTTPEVLAEREKTDEHLDSERAQADEALSIHAVVSEASADEKIESVRERADAVLRAVRDKVNRKLATADERVLDVIEAERSFADRTREAEKKAEDAVREAERQATAHEVARVLPVERDNTDAALAEERVRADEAIAARDDTLAIVSHELRTLFGGIVMSAAVIEASVAEVAKGATVKNEARRIQTHTFRMTRLLNDLLDVVSIDAGRLTCRPGVNDPRALVEEAIRVCAQAAQTKSIRLEPQLENAPNKASYDHDRMLQVLANLIGNAIKFTPAGGRVVVACVAIGDALELAVSDTGPGIPENIRHAVFEKFKQADAEGRPGVGLGLFIARSIVSAHGGRIWIDSPPEGGARAVCVIPNGPLVRT